MPLCMTVSALLLCRTGQCVQIISLSGSVSLFIEICGASWTVHQPVEMLLSVRNNRGTELKVTSTLRDGFETVIPVFGLADGRHIVWCDLIDW